MGFVNDQKGEAVFTGQIVQGILQLREQTGESVGWFLMQSQQDLGVKGSGVEFWIGKVNQRVQIAVKGVDKGTQSG